MNDVAWICVRSEDAQKQLAWTSLIDETIEFEVISSHTEH